MTPLIINIIGPKRSGKNTVAELLLKNPPITGSYITLAFATPLKEAAMDLLDLSSKDLEDHKEVFRPFLQWYGTEYMDYLGDPSRWVGKFYESLCSFICNSQNLDPDLTPVVLVTDTRFAKEFNYLNKLKESGYCVFTVRIEDREPLGEDLHRSEQEWRNQPVEFCIHNSGTLEELDHIVDTKLSPIIEVVYDNFVASKERCKSHK